MRILFFIAVSPFILAALIWRFIAQGLYFGYTLGDALLGDLFRG